MKDTTTALDRRHFLSHLGAMAAASSVALNATAQAGETAASPSPATPQSTPLPTIKLGPHDVTRLVVGSNPFNGNSYLGPNLNRHMSEYYTIDREVEFLLSCEAAGINTHQFSTSALDKSAQCIAKLRERGSKLKYFCIHSNLKEIPKVIERTQPIAILHHGSATDSLFAKGQFDRVKDFVKAVHDQGLLAGVSAHNPDCIKTIVDEGWDVDCFMTCFFNLSRKAPDPYGRKPGELETVDASGPFFLNDREIMAHLAGQVKQTCFAFKIMAAGRLGANPKWARGAFQYAFEHIKPKDAVIVGMFPQYFDELKANVGYTLEFGRAVA